MQVDANRSKLTNNQAAQIKRLWQESDLCPAEIAKIVSVPEQAVFDIIFGRTHLDISPAPF
ncbi:MAG: hypothetical protein AAF292_08380 [Pseudomonadota bacterium]